MINGNANISGINNSIGLLIKSDEDWFNETQKLYTKGFIDYVNHWHLDQKTKPVNLEDGSPVYIYTQAPVSNYIIVRAKGKFRLKAFNVNTNEGLLNLDSKRVSNVRESYELYGPSNGSVSYGGYLNLLQSYADVNGKAIQINDNHLLGATIITDLEFYPQQYQLINGTINQCGFRYIEDIQGNQIHLRKSDKQL